MTPDFEVFTEAGDLEDVPPPALSTRLFGQEHHLQFMLDGHKSNRLHHGILLRGERGVGKATLGYHFANAVLGGSLSTPAPASTAYRQIAQNGHPSLLRISRARTDSGAGFKTVISIADIRRINTFLSMSSGGGGHRMVIIDAINDMQRPAANALLKILEEPPQKTYFLLIAHGTQGVLPTIKSRTMEIRLSPLDNEALRQALEALSVSSSADQIKSAVVAGGGSVRRALTLLNYGGADLGDGINRLLLSDPFDVKQAHMIADVFAKKGNDVQRGLIFDLLDEAIHRETMLRVSAGRLEDAAQLSKLAAKLNEDRVTFISFNLDPRHEAIVFLQEVHAVFGKLAA
ncbi:MAG: hypothetical protein AAGI92_00890 [Pseudomonadota bacterium]